MNDEIKVTAPGKPYTVDKCDGCGRELDPRTDGVLLHTESDKIFCVQCALRNEGATEDEIANPAFVEHVTRGIHERRPGNRLYIPDAFPDIAVRHGEIPVDDAPFDPSAVAEGFAEYVNAYRDYLESLATMFVTRGHTGTKQDIRNVLSMTDGVELAGIIEHPNEIAAEIIIIGERFNRQDLAAAIHDSLPVPYKTIGEHTERYDSPTTSITHEYRWTEFTSLEAFAFWYIAKQNNVETATGEDLDRLAKLTPMNPDGVRRLLGGKKGEDNGNV